MNSGNRGINDKASTPWYAFVPGQRDLSHTSILYYCYDLCPYIISILDTGS
jgi:hypothetical protein